MNSVIREHQGRISMFAWKKLRFIYAKSVLDKLVDDLQREIIEKII